MARRTWLMLALPMLTTASATAQQAENVAHADNESVYAPPVLETPEQGINQGGVHIRLDVNYMTDYVFRGIEPLEVPGNEDAPNLQVDGKLSFDLGKLPHPFIGVFANVADQDPISEFQEIRPSFGFDWNLRPIIFTAGYNSFIYPDRSDSDTSEVYAKLTLADDFIFSTREPILSPYVMVAYDFDLYDGVYVEAGVEHTFHFDDIGVTLTAYGHVAYVDGISLYVSPDAADPEDDSGFQHYQIGLIGAYSLNSLFNVSPRYGDWSLVGYLNYTDSIDSNLRADTQLWGGAGIRFEY